MKRSDMLISALRARLRASGWTARRLAAQLGVGEATVKRWLAGKGLTLDRLDALASLAETSLAELARLAERPGAGLAQELTLAQERALSSDGFLSFLFMVILGGYDVAEVARDFEVPARQMESALLRLERLALIDRLPMGRVRPLVDRAIIWRKTPMRAQFEARMKPQFLDMDFAAENAVYVSDILKLSAQGAAQLAELIEKHRRDVQALAEQDRATSHLPQSWYGMLCAARPLDMTGLQQETAGERQDGAAG
ncbi:MAG: helix-turn-helix domain-containing protein [Chakrabartia sp.]